MRAYTTEIDAEFNGRECSLPDIPSLPDVNSIDFYVVESPALTDADVIATNMTGNDSDYDAIAALNYGQMPDALDPTGWEVVLIPIL